MKNLKQEEIEANIVDELCTRAYNDLSKAASMLVDKGALKSVMQEFDKSVGHIESTNEKYVPNKSFRISCPTTVSHIIAPPWYARLWGRVKDFFGSFNYHGE